MLRGRFKRVGGYVKRVPIGFKRVRDIRHDAWWIPCDIYLLFPIPLCIEY
jgi:hypothetical protein